MASYPSISGSRFFKAPRTNDFRSPDHLPFQSFNLRPTSTLGLTDAPDRLTFPPFKSGLSCRHQLSGAIFFSICEYRSTLVTKTFLVLSFWFPHLDPLFFSLIILLLSLSALSFEIRPRTLREARPTSPSNSSPLSFHGLSFAPYFACLFRSRASLLMEE